MYVFSCFTDDLNLLVCVEHTLHDSVRFTCSRHTFRFRSNIFFRSVNPSWGWSETGLCSFPSFYFLPGKMETFACIPSVLTCPSCDGNGRQGGKWDELSWWSLRLIVLAQMAHNRSMGRAWYWYWYFFYSWQKIHTLTICGLILPEL